MNPGPTEEVAKVATGFMSVMQREPLSLALVLMNIALLTYMFYETRTVHQGRLETVKILIEMQKEVQQLLSKCVVPTPKPTGALLPDVPAATLACSPGSPRPE